MPASSVDEPWAAILDAIDSVHAALIKTAGGLEAARKKSDAAIDDKLHGIRQANLRHAAELKRFLAGHGRRPSHNGSGRLGPLLADIDAEALPAVAEVERQLVACYDDALEQLLDHQNTLQPDEFDAAHSLLTHHRAEIEQAVRQLRAFPHPLDA